MAEVMWAKVALDIPVFRFFSYKVPAELSDIIAPGCRVLVPVRNRVETGIVVSLNYNNPESKDLEFKEIEEILDEEPLIPQPLLNLLIWVSDFYIYPPGQVISSVFPRALRINTGAYIYPGSRFEELKYLNQELYLLLKQKKRLRLSYLKKEFKIGHLHLLRWVARGFLDRQDKRIEKKKKVEFYRLIKIPDDYNPGRVEKRIVNFLKGKGWVARKEISKVVPSARKNHFSSLLERGVVDRKEDYFIEDLLWGREKEFTTFFSFSDVQKEAFEKIKEKFSQFRAVLLHGYTGSGKTVIYAELIKEYLSAGKGAILLVPEIALTPQLVNFFATIFGENVAVLHSGLTESERFSEFMKIRRGEKRVVVGVRSAVFAPIPDLGIIIMDEEHENTYKQEEGFIYHARNVAYKRAEFENAHFLLASATPSVETYYAAEKGKIGRVELFERYGKRGLPELKIIDLRDKKPSFGIFSDELVTLVRERLQKKEQSILFLNRRGFAPVIICEKCGEVIKCPNCDVPMVYHHRTGKLVCHYCNYSTDVPAACPRCGSHSLKEIGAGTERVEDVAKLLFPSATIKRLDRDTVSSRRKFDEIIENMEDGSIDVLIGTQMVTKGLHFENVTLSGVILAEQTLSIPDFRAGERTYQLISQIIGRSGRGEKKGVSVVQTYYPEHFVLQNVGEENYKNFFETELSFRKEGLYPPFSRLLLFLLSASTPESAEKNIKVLYHQLLKIREESGKNFQILGPSRNPIFFLRRRYRYNLLLKAWKYEVLNYIGKKVFEEKKKLLGSNVSLKIDIDPYVFI